MFCMVCLSAIAHLAHVTFSTDEIARDPSEQTFKYALLTVIALVPIAAIALLWMRQWRRTEMRHQRAKIARNKEFLKDITGQGCLSICCCLKDRKLQEQAKAAAADNFSLFMTSMITRKMTSALSIRKKLQDLTLPQLRERLADATGDHLEYKWEDLIAVAGGDVNDMVTVADIAEEIIDIVVMIKEQRHPKHQFSDGPHGLGDAVSVDALKTLKAKYQHELYLLEKSHYAEIQAHFQARRKVRTATQTAHTLNRERRESIEKDIDEAAEGEVASAFDDDGETDEFSGIVPRSAEAGESSGLPGTPTVPEEEQESRPQADTLEDEQSGNFDLDALERELDAALPMLAEQGGIS